MTFPLRKVIDFVMTKQVEVDKAYRLFFGDLPFDKLQTQWEELFLEWLVFDFQQTSGATFLVEYILKNPDGLADDRLSQFEQIAKTHFYSSFEILEIHRGQYFVLEDLFSGKKYQVYEKKGTESISGVGTIPGRIGQVDGRWYLVGANSVYFPMTHIARAKKHMRQFSVKNYTPKDTVELLMQHSQSQPKPQVHSQKQIEAKRKELEEAYKKYITEYSITLDFSDLLKEIYLENRVNVLDFWKSLEKKGLPERFMFEQFQVLQDIWNFFPHQCLNGLSPIEAYSKFKQGK